MDIYGTLLRTVLFPAWETAVRRRPTMELASFVRHTQWLSLDELGVLQLAALKRLVRVAYEHVPFYRSRFDAVGMAPGDLRTLEDLRRLPVLTRDDLRTSGADRYSSVEPLPVIRKQTSGTTGEPLLFGYDRASECWRRALWLRGYEWAGYRMGDRVLHFWGAPVTARPMLRTRAKIGLDRTMKRETFVSCTVMSEQVLLSAARTIARRRPKVLVCYTQAGAELARFVLDRRLRDWGSLAVICGAERLLPGDRAVMEAAFGEVFETYGCREVMLIGSECASHDGLHVSMENLIVEVCVTRPDGSRRPARVGEVGEVLLTDLHNLGMPFIRYANGDVAVAGAGGTCSCGRALTRLSSVQGRASEGLRDANGDLVSGVACSFLFADVGSAVRRFQLVQHRDRSVTVRVVPNEPLPAGLTEELRGKCSRMLGGLAVRVEALSDLPRSPAGKHRLVVVEND